MEKIKNFYKLLIDKKYSTLAGALSFFFILSSVPFFFLALYLFNFFARNIDFVSEINNVSFLEFDFSSPISILFIITTLYSASKLFYHIRRTGEIIYDYKKNNSGLKHRIASFTTLIIFLFIVVSTLLVGLSAKTLIIRYKFDLLIRIITYTVQAFAIVGVLLLLNVQASPRKNPIKKYLRGTLFSALFIFIASAIFMIYLRYFANYGHLYGYLTTFIIVFVWVYIIMTGVIIGIIINSKKS